ncbi:hypothetical protein HBH78_021290 [Parastagonospora nodorum]|nr:hypothetical protein HBH78_021290 [Parastagonospora nodorum]KAH5323394.1 hypothetical protein HBI11_042640 [Parastagonospora nodorum]
MARLKELPEPTKARMPQAEVEKLAAEVEAVLREPVNHSIEKAKEFMRAKEEREPRIDAGPEYDYQPQGYRSALAQTESYSQGSVSSLNVHRQGAGSHAQSSVSVLQAE